MTRVVIYSESAGVFIGTCLGLAFFSEMDAAGQERAVTFADEAEARSFVATWRNEPEPPWRCVQVETSKDNYATIDDCVRAGLPRWKP